METILIDPPIITPFL